MLSKDDAANEGARAARTAPSESRGYVLDASAISAWAHHRGSTNASRMYFVAQAATARDFAAMIRDRKWTDKSLAWLEEGIQSIEEWNSQASFSLQGPIEAPRDGQLYLVDYRQNSRGGTLSVERADGLRPNDHLRRDGEYAIDTIEADFPVSQLVARDGIRRPGDQRGRVQVIGEFRSRRDFARTLARSGATTMSERMAFAATSTPVQRPYVVLPRDPERLYVIDHNEGSLRPLSGATGKERPVRTMHPPTTFMTIVDLAASEGGESRHPSQSAQFILGRFRTRSAFIDRVHALQQSHQKRPTASLPVMRLPLHDYSYHRQPGALYGLPLTAGPTSVPGQVVLPPA